jgi:hypothetical protein
MERLSRLHGRFVTNADWCSSLTVGAEAQTANGDGNMVQRAAAVATGRLCLNTDSQ